MHILKRFRLAKKMKQSEAAEYFGLSQTQISLIERGKRSLTLKVAKKMATDPEIGGEFTLDRIYFNDVGEDQNQAA